MTTISCSDCSSLSGADKVLLDSIIEYYNENTEYITKLISIVKRKNGMSLRVIDYLCTNYSKENSIIISTKDGHIPRDLNSDYQKNLNAYNKKYLDPFSRRNKIVINVSYDNNETHEKRNTSIGQLNFFRWFFKNNIDQYLSREKKTVEAHMKKMENESKKSKKRKAVKMCTPRSYVGSFVMNFD